MTSPCEDVVPLLAFAPEASLGMVPMIHRSTRTHVGPPNQRAPIESLWFSTFVSALAGEDSRPLDFRLEETRDERRNR